MTDLSSHYGIPKYLTILLELSGYTAEISVKTALKRSSQEFVNNLKEYAKIILSEDFPHENIRETFKQELQNAYISCDPTKLRLPPGHCDFLIGTFGPTQELLPEPLPVTSSHEAQNYQPNPPEKRKISECLEPLVDEDTEETTEDQENYSDTNCTEENKKMKLSPIKAEEYIEYEDDSQISHEYSTPLPGKRQIEEQISYFTEKNKRRLVLLLKKCWPKEIIPPEFFIIEEVGQKSWVVQCPVCENLLKIFLNTAGGYLRFNKANFQRHLMLHSKKTNDSCMQNEEVLE